MPTSANIWEQAKAIIKANTQLNLKIYYQHRKTKRAKRSWSKGLHFKKHIDQSTAKGNRTVTRQISFKTRASSICPLKKIYTYI